jgi:hypothetical protein
MEETKRRLVQRHLKHWTKAKTEQWGGDGPDAAAAKAQANDLKNAACIQKHSQHNANLIIKNEVIPADNNNDSTTTNNDEDGSSDDQHQHKKQKQHQ